MKGYGERVFKAVEIVGGKVKRPEEAKPKQSREELVSAMRSWMASSRARRGGASQ